MSNKTSNYANSSCTRQSRGITSYEEIGQTRIPEPRAIQPSRGLRVKFRVFLVFRI